MEAVFALAAPCDHLAVTHRVVSHAVPGQVAALHEIHRAVARRYADAGPNPTGVLDRGIGSGLEPNESTEIAVERTERDIIVATWSVRQCQNGDMDLRTPSESDYSTNTNPERFEAVVAFTLAIIDELRVQHVVDQSDGEWATDFPQFVDWVDHRPPPVRLIPSSGARLVFGFTPAPGVVVRVGRSVVLLFPDCLCDACNAQVDDVCEDLRFHIEAVTAGGFQEAVGWRWHQWSFGLDSRTERSMSRIERGERKALGRRRRYAYGPWTVRA